MSGLRRLSAVLLAVFLLTAPGAAQAKAPDASPCKGGGFAGYVDPATGEPFVEQGQCVSFVRHGGTLVPVAPPLELSPWTLVQAPETGHIYCTASATLTGAAATTYPVTWVVDGASTEDTVTTDDAGAATVSRVLREGVPAELVVDDQTFALPEVNCDLPTPDVTVSMSSLGGNPTVRVFGPVAPFGWYELTWSVDGTERGTDGLQAGEDGTFEAHLYAFPGQAIEALIDGVSVGSVTVE